MRPRETLVVTGAGGTLFCEEVDLDCRFCAWLRLRCQSWQPATTREFRCVACGASYVWTLT